MKRKIIIAIDGYSSCGKSTIARSLAGRIRYKHIDTGAMYRAVTLHFIRKGISVDEIDQIQAQLKDISIDFWFNPSTNQQETLLNNENVEKSIREWAVTEQVSAFSALKPVREKLVKLQQAFGREKGIIMDGRDIGTQVFPEAELKVFVTADPEVRAKRRFKELVENGYEGTLESVAQNLTDRDYQDVNRKESPLIKADDARVLDTTNLTPEEQLEMVCEWVEEIELKNSHK